MALRILADLPDQARLAVIKLRSLGDCVLMTPAIQLVSSFRPDIEIAVMVEDRFALVFSGSHHVSAVLPPSISFLRRFRPDVVMNLHGGTRSMWLTALSGARWRAGFAHHAGSVLYNAPIPRAQQIFGAERAVHTAEHLASAMFYLGVPSSPVPRARLTAIAVAHQRPGIGSPYAVIHPFASNEAKTWPARCFLEAAEHLQRQQLTPVFIGTSADPLDAFRTFAVVQGASLEELKSLIAHARFFLGNDSGPAHIAAAFDVPTLVLFGASDPAAWRPWHGNSDDGIERRDYLVADQGLAALPAAAVCDAFDKMQVTH